MDGHISQQGLGPEGDSCPGVGAVVPMPSPSPRAPKSTGVRPGVVWKQVVLWCLTSMGSRSMSLSDRDVPMAKATFFTWEDNSSSILALQGTGASSAGMLGRRGCCP